MVMIALWMRASICGKIRNMIVVSRRKMKVIGALRKSKRSPVWNWEGRRQRSVLVRNA
jgi:hypothetical protein